MSYYAIHKGHKIGVFENWDECKKNIDNYPNARYKKFNNINDANKFVQDGINTNNSGYKSLKNFVVKGPEADLVDIEEDFDDQMKKYNKKKYTKNLNYFSNEESIDEYNPDIVIYTDGSCINNGKNNAKAGYGIYFELNNYRNDFKNISKKVDGKQSNNTAELTAIIEAIKIIENDIINNNIKVLITSDSEYAIKCATSYGEKNYKSNWSNNIPNQNLVKELYLYCLKYKNNIKFYHIYSHTNKQDKYSLGNEEADKLANEAIIDKYSKNIENKISKIYINVPYSTKDDAKLLGAKWDSKIKSWYIDTSINEVNKMKLLQLYQIK